ncbi:MAG: amidohydrolase family protein [Candidatus Woesearchaeota archaeon]
MLIKNCVLSDGTKADILIEGGRIKKIARMLHQHDDYIDAGGRYLIPGIIDPHVHFREPGGEQKEDFLTGGFAAAAGGITTVLDMPNNEPPITTTALLEMKRKLAEKSVVNYGFHFAGTPHNIEQIRAAKNIASTKVFMNPSTGMLMFKDDDALKQVFADSKMVSVHAEGSMVEKAIHIAQECGARLYLCHISSADEIDFIRENKSSNIFVEVTPHHLFLSEEDDMDGFTKMKPGLKSIADQLVLYDAINEGVVDTIGSDHAPHTIGEKLSKDFPYGVPGCETLLPLLLNAVNEGLFSLRKVVELCCENPARTFGIMHKGFIREGFDADLTIIDMERVCEVDEEKLFTKCKWSPFAGRKLKGWPIMTIVNGNLVFNDGEIYDSIKGKEVNYYAF